MRAKLTPAFVEKAAPPETGVEVVYWDTGLAGFGLAVTRAGHKSYVVGYRANGRKRRMHLKRGLTFTDARRQAIDVINTVAKGGDPLGDRRKVERAKADTFKAIWEEWAEKAGGGLRSLKERQRVFGKQIGPVLGLRPIEEITRTDIVRLVDKIVAESGPVVADSALAYIRRVMNWHQARSETYRSPIVRGMNRTNPIKLRRQRILTDDELCAFWAAAEAGTGPFPRFLQFVLLTAVRRSEAAGMARSELQGDDWIIPEQRYKTGLKLLVPLSPAARAVLKRVPVVGEAGLVFTTDGRHPISGFNTFKRAFDVAMLAELRRTKPDAVLSRWTIHDLRRTARSLMSRAGVPTDHAERCLGHAKEEIRATYDLWEFHPEKKRAFEALAALIGRILRPPVGNVRQLHR